MLTNEKQYRFVGYFDILGYKSLTLRHPEKAWDVVNNLRKLMDEISKLHVYVHQEQVLIKNRVQVRILADSVIFLTAEDKNYDLITILILTSELFAKCLSKCILLRGGITHGELFYNLKLNLFAGIPFVRAYELEKEIKWSGIIVDDFVAERSKELKNITTLNGGPLIVSWDAPLKNNTTEKRWALDWVTPHKTNFRVSLPLSVKDYYAAFEQLFGPFEELSIEDQQKYTNTVKFINSLLLH